VVIAFYLFYRVRSGTPNAASNVSYDAVLRFEDRPDDFNDTVKRFGEPVTWQSIHHAVAHVQEGRSVCMTEIEFEKTPACQAG